MTDKVDWNTTVPREVLGSGTNLLSLMRDAGSERQLRMEAVAPTVVIAGGIAGSTAMRQSLDAVSTVAERRLDIFGTSVVASEHLGKRMLMPVVAVGAEEMLQKKMSKTLAEKLGLPKAAEIVEPNLFGAGAKTAALMFASDSRAKALTFAGAQLYEAEVNMSRQQRIEVTAFGLGSALALKAIGSGKLSTTVALASLGIGLAAEITDRWFYKKPDQLHEIHDVKMH